MCCKRTKQVASKEIVFFVYHFKRDFTKMLTDCIATVGVQSMTTELDCLLTELL